MAHIDNVKMDSIDINAVDCSSLERSGTGKEAPSASINDVTSQLGRLAIDASENNQYSNSNAKENHRTHKRVPSDEGYESERNSRDGKDSTSTLPLNTICPALALTFTSTLLTSPLSENFAKTYTIFAQTATGTEAGTVSARFIDRSALKTQKSNKISNFYTNMQKLNSCNSDGWALASALFCEKGMLLKGIKAAGPWGSEIERGALLVVKFLCVEKGYRRQGLARKLLGELVRKVRERMEEKRKKKGKLKGTRKDKGEELTFMVVFPAIIKDDFKEEMEGKSEVETVKIEKRAYENAVGFYTAFGFRQVGVSGWYAFAYDEKHSLEEEPAYFEEREGWK